MSAGKITVCIAAKRIDLFFKRAVHSVIAQLRPPDEVVVVIDGISKNLKGHRWVREIPSSWVVAWTEEENSGSSYLKNIGMHLSSGDWIFVLMGDDFMLPTCLEKYEKILKTTKSDLIVEYRYAELCHHNFQVTRSIPRDKSHWVDITKSINKGLITGSWRRGVLPLRPVLIKNSVKKYYPLDYHFAEDSILTAYYLLEERRIGVSDVLGYIANIHPVAHDPKHSNRIFGTDLDEIRFKRAASNIHINGWTLKEKIFEFILSSTFLDNCDIDYIEQTISYYTFS